MWHTLVCSILLGGYILVYSIQLKMLPKFHKNYSNSQSRRQPAVGNLLGLDLGPFGDKSLGISGAWPGGIGLGLGFGFSLFLSLTWVLREGNSEVMTVFKPQVSKTLAMEIKCVDVTPTVGSFCPLPTPSRAREGRRTGIYRRKNCWRARCWRRRSLHWSSRVGAPPAWCLGPCHHWHTWSPLGTEEQTTHVRCWNQGAADKAQATILTPSSGVLTNHVSQQLCRRQIVTSQWRNLVDATITKQ